MYQEGLFEVGDDLLVSAHPFVEAQNVKFVTGNGSYLVHFPVRQLVELQQKLLQHALVALHQRHLQPWPLDLRYPQVAQKCFREETVRFLLPQPPRLTGEQTAPALPPPEQLHRQTLLFLVCHWLRFAPHRPPNPPQILQTDALVAAQHDLPQPVRALTRLLLAEGAHHRQTDPDQRPGVQHQTQRYSRQGSLLPGDFGEPVEEGVGGGGGGRLELRHAKYLRGEDRRRVESPGSSAGQSVGLMSQRSRVRSPPRAFLFHPAMSKGKGVQRQGRGRVEGRVVQGRGRGGVGLLYGVEGYKVSEPADPCYTQI